MCPAPPRARRRRPAGESVGKPGCGDAWMLAALLRCAVHGIGRACRRHRTITSKPHLLKLLRDRLQMLLDGAAQVEVAAGDRGGGGEGARFDAVGVDGELRAAQTGRLPRSRCVFEPAPDDPPTQRVDEMGAGDHVRLDGGVHDLRRALRQSAAAAMIWVVAPTLERSKDDLRAVQAVRRGGFHDAVLDADPRASSCSRPFRMEVHGASADIAAAGQRDAGSSGYGRGSGRARKTRRASFLISS